MNNDDIEIIGVDHGWSKIKTVGSVFTSGVKKIATEPALADNIVYSGSSFYKVGGARLEVKENKVSDNNYYILTLAAIAKEMKRRGLSNANILLAAGLPLTRFGAEKQAFIDYLSQEKMREINFERTIYHVNIEHISVFPQCYAAVADRLSFYKNMVLVVEIGSWTIELMPIINQKPDEGRCITIPRGLITCMRAINEECVRQIGSEISEWDMEQVMRNGTSDIPIKYLQIIQEELRNFARKIYFSIKEYGYNLDTTQIVFAGGGARVMKLFGDLPTSNIQYLQDIKANAKGYEYLANIYLANQYRK